MGADGRSNLHSAGKAEREAQGLRPQAEAQAEGEEGEEKGDRVNAYSDNRFARVLDMAAEARSALVQRHLLQERINNHKKAAELRAAIRGSLLDKVYPRADVNGYQCGWNAAIDEARRIVDALMK